MFTGAIERTPAGILAERYNPKTIYTCQMLLAAPPLFMLSYIETLWGYMWLGLWIGLSGTSFTIGIRHVTDWFDSQRQGAPPWAYWRGQHGNPQSHQLWRLLVEIMGWSSLGPIYGAGLI